MHRVVLLIFFSVVISLKSAVATIVGPHTDESGLSTGILFSISNVQANARVFKLKGTNIDTCLFAQNVFRITICYFFYSFCVMTELYFLSPNAIDRDRLGATHQQCVETNPVCN